MPKIVTRRDKLLDIMSRSEVSKKESKLLDIMSRSGVQKKEKQTFGHNVQKWSVKKGKANFWTLCPEVRKELGSMIESF